MVNNIYPKAGILLKVVNVFCSENLAVFTVTSICSIRKSTHTKETLKQQDKGNRRFKTVQG